MYRLLQLDIRCSRIKNAVMIAKIVENRYPEYKYCIENTSDYIPCIEFEEDGQYCVELNYLWYCFIIVVLLFLLL